MHTASKLVSDNHIILLGTASVVDYKMISVINRDKDTNNIFDIYM